MLRGIDKIVKVCKEKLGVDMEGITADGLFTMKAVECLGACVNAPVVQINDDFVEDLTVDNFMKILEDLKRIDLDAADRGTPTLPLSAWHPEFGSWMVEGI